MAAPTRDWSAYNRAQVSEPKHFDRLLADLVQVAPDNSRDDGEPGRPPTPLSRQAFCAIKKVYEGVPIRRAQALFDRAAERGFIEESPHFNVVSRFLNDERAGDVLQHLLAESARPFVNVEDAFALDSTGFSAASFGEYRVNKHGNGDESEEVEKRREWQKLHVCSGIESNVVTAARVTPRKGEGTGDISQFEPLLHDTKEVGFRINRVLADAAYCSRDAYDLVDELGGRAYIDFPSNATGSRHGSRAWEEAYKTWKNVPTLFKHSYHDRSNVESTFGAIKERVGERIDSRNAEAQRNEVLCKLVAYNVSVFVHWWHEQGPGREPMAR